MILPAIGELKEVLDIVNVTAPYQLDGSGKIISKFCSGIRAKVDYGGGQLADQTQKIQIYTQDYRIWIRYRRGVAAFQQIVWRGKRLVITAPPEPFGQFLLINAQETISRTI
jgi:head-tail adaptor